MKPFDEAKTEQFSALCKAMSHPMRVKLIALLQESADKNGWVCNDLVKKLPISQSTVSEHLRILRESNLVIREVHGQNSRYRINDKTIKEFKGLMNKF